VKNGFGFVVERAPDRAWYARIRLTDSEGVFYFTMFPTPLGRKEMPEDYADRIFAECGKSAARARRDRISALSRKIAMRR